VQKCTDCIRYKFSGRHVREAPVHNLVRTTAPNIRLATGQSLNSQQKMWTIADTKCC